nr:urokinase plasminogen activator surface receptor isoform X1 [Taeniopygia guttata]
MRLGKAGSAAKLATSCSLFPSGKKKSIRVSSASRLVSGLQCYGCNIVVGTKNVDMGCSNPEVITCSQSHQGFKHRFCIKTESVVLGILLTSGCATSRHCQQQELPGVRIHCCDTDLCNTSPGAPRPPPGHLLLLPCILTALLLW